MIFLNTVLSKYVLNCSAVSLSSDIISSLSTKIVFDLLSHCFTKQFISRLSTDTISMLKVGLSPSKKVVFIASMKAL